jgi:hypothetical protein
MRPELVELKPLPALPTSAESLGGRAVRLARAAAAMHMAEAARVTLDTAAKPVWLPMDTRGEAAARRGPAAVFAEGAD